MGRPPGAELELREQTGDTDVSDDADATRKRLDRIGERLDLVLRGPGAIEAQLFFRVARPLFAIARWRAELKTTALPPLFAALRDWNGSAPASDGTDRAALLRLALDELEANVVTVERVAIVHRRVPLAHALWLRRVHSVLLLVERALASDATPSLRRSAVLTDPSALFPPLVALEPQPKPKRGGARKASASEDDEPDVSSVVDLELAAIDHLFAAARAESLVLGRRRRLLVAARQRLLEASAALPLARDGVRDRMRHAAREITRIDRLQAAGLATDVSLLHQARQALVRRDTRRLFASLSAIDGNALASMDHDIARRTGDALGRIGGHESPDGAAAFERSARELLGVIASDVESAVRETRDEASERLVTSGLPSDRVTARSLLKYLPESSASALLRAATFADGFFEVGGALAAVRVDEEERVLRVVRHPTQNLLLRPADDVNDLRDAVIGDPRSILLDLATGRLFARRFVTEETRKRPRIVRRGEVRVYVLDGSGSMSGPRARVRDAILVAELSTLIRRLEEPGDTDCTLFYRYFDTELGPTSRVQTVQAARDAIRDIVATQRSGGTDIERALVGSLEQIAEARAHDPDLARAQIVLVTDGAAEVDEDEIVAARRALGGLPVGVSVIALGEENPALRGIVARQRARGEAAFYHFIDDAELAAITDGSLTTELPIHPPARWEALERDPKALAEALDEEVSGLLDDLESIDRGRDLAALERIEEEAQARREVGLSDEGLIGAHDGEGARIEALRRDRVALSARFARWFPAISASNAAHETALPRLGTPERDDVDATCCALASVAEVVALLGGSELARQADAIDLIERLLPDARLSPARYRAVLREFPHAVAASLRSLHDAVSGPRPS